ncbi:MAG: membrane dipeptidase [Myxococcales bacterium]|nr:membrane dipeptidase [Myxococcales bacterium]
MGCLLLPATLHERVVAEHVDIEALHRRVAVADGHADSLMWNRDLTQASDEGHVDFPRLQAAGVKLQCFTVVTRGLPVLDGFSLFARRQNWPTHARASEWSRCTFQIDRLAHFCRESNGVASIAGKAAHLDANLKEGRISAVLGVEGAHAIEGKVERVAELFERGVRFMSLTHLANNELGGTCTRFLGNRPLTPLGREVLDAMGEVGMAVDVAHASPAMLPDVLSHPKARPFCSHAGVKGATDMWRNLPDEALKAIADRGGVVGVIFAPQFLGGSSLEHLARHIEHAVNVMGEDGAALGSDFDGMVPLPQGMRDVRDLPKLTRTLLDRGMPVRIVEKVLGNNFRRFFGELLP